MGALRSHNPSCLDPFPQHNFSLAMSDPKVNQLSCFQVISPKLTEFYKVLSIPLQGFLNTFIQTHSACIHLTKKKNLNSISPIPQG